MAFCKIAEQGSTIEKEIAAKIRGVSRYGMEIVHEGTALEKSAGVVITIDLVNSIFRKKATVAWSRSLSGYEAVAGLEFTEPIPLSQVVTLS
ncbi:MAG: hypothetical protein HY954_08765 [Deltaproteobacteria bacterium]|nr:hypothetical protein [Deltaproteobacteria bacterium]